MEREKEEEIFCFTNLAFCIKEQAEREKERAVEVFYSM
jgi:hypothetical protein